MIVSLLLALCFAFGMAVLTEVTPGLIGTNGAPIVVSGTATGASVTIYTATASAANMDQIELFAWNNSASSVLLTLELAGDTTNILTVTIPGNAGQFPVYRGRLNNSKTIKAFAATGNVISLTGTVDTLVVA